MDDNILLQDIDDEPAHNVVEDDKIIHKQPTRKRKPVVRQPIIELTDEEKLVEEKIAQYKNSTAFTIELADIDWKNKNRVELLQTVESQCTNTVSFDYMMGVMILFQQLEKIANKKSNDRFTGLAKALSEDLQVRKNIELLRIKYLSKLQGYINMPPEYSLMLSIAAVSIRTFLRNAPKELTYEE